jgi:hypothetical protein
MRLLAVAGLLLGLLAPAARADDRVQWLRGVPSPGTPARYDKVGVLKFGPARARDVLVLVPGTSAGAGYFAPLARTLTHEEKGWQVWSVERRENLLEDESVLDAYKAGATTPQRFFDYYLGWYADPAIAPHFQPVPDAAAGFARDWGMSTEVGDLRRVIAAARAHGRRVVLGGHSLGGSIATAYATWDFHGRAGARDLAGLVFIDGISGPQAVSAEQARQQLAALRASTPWLAFGGIPAPLLGLFSAVSASLARLAPDPPALLANWPLLPASLKAPVPVTDLSGFGYDVDAATSPPSLVAAQVHAGHLTASGDPRGWVRAGALTPLRRWADMLSGTGLKGTDGSAWYHPQRLTVDAGAVGGGRPNPAQQVLGVHAIHGDRVHVPIYAFAAALGGTRVLAAARALARRSHLPARELTLVDRHRTYAHNDPAAAAPAGNAFLRHLEPFLRRIARQS